MPGFLFGTLCLFGLFLLLARPWRHKHHRAWGRCGGHRRYRRSDRDAYDREGDREYTQHDPLHVAFGGPGAAYLGRRLGLEEEQQGIVEAALADTRRTLNSLWSTLSDSRSEIAAALRGENVDDDKLDAVFAWHDEALQHARRELTTSWKAALLALSPEQRARVADLVAGRGQGGWV